MKVRSNTLRSCPLLVHGVEVQVDASGRFEIDEAEARYLAQIPGYSIEEPEVAKPDESPKADVAEDDPPADDDKPKRGKQRKG